MSEFNFYESFLVEKIDYQEIGDFMNKKKKKLEQKQQAINEEDRNYNKFQNTKLFQKFMKEEIGNDLKNACDTQPNLYENYS